jgi:hypothetical protein
MGDNHHRPERVVANRHLRMTVGPYCVSAAGEEH